MASPRVAEVLRYVRALADPERGGERTDADLLRQFVARRDEGAFADLLARHGPLVLGVCRQVLGNEADAEDAFQATFLVLARKAASVRSRQSLSAWLYRVALNLARTARGSAARRRAVERQVAAMSPVRPALAPPDDWRPLLHEEVDRLPEKYRVPIVLCYLEGRTNEEAARELGWPVGTVKGRLARARDLLGTRLTRRGLALPAGGVGLLLTQSAVRAAIPAALADSTLKAALQFAAGPTASSAASVLLANGALKTGALGRPLLVALIVSVAAAAATAGGLLALPTRADRPAAGAAEQPDPEPVPGVKESRPVPRPRIVFVGDSSTDGNTYLLLIRQALARAGRPVPLCVNAGVSMDTARGMRQRLERDVFAHRPTLVVLSAGIADATATCRCPGNSRWARCPAS